MTTALPLHIGDAPWLAWPQTQAVLAALGQDKCRFVGGVVRDQLLGLPVADIDLATTLMPDQVMAQAQAAGLKAVATGIDHGTVTLIADHHPFEVTTLRADVKGHGRHADVAFIKDWQADAARRDFTINALYADARGQIEDWFGGLEDLAAGQVRFIGDAGARIREDGLRIMRFFRFTARFGRAGVDPSGLIACRDHLAMLDHVSVERVAQELLRLLSAPNPMPMISAMVHIDLFPHILPHRVNKDRLEQLVAKDTMLDAIDPVRRLMALFDEPETRLAVAKELKLSKDVQKRMGQRPPPDRCGHLDHMLYWHGPEGTSDCILLELDGKDRTIDQLRQALAHIAQFDRPVFPLTGRDLMRRGYTEGPTMGDQLARLERTWVDSGFRLGRDDLLDLLVSVKPKDPS